MVPTYKPGEQVITFNWARPKVGDVVIFKREKVNMIKRVKDVEKDKIFVEGDNGKESSNIGWVEKKDIIGKVIVNL